MITEGIEEVLGRHRHPGLCASRCDDYEEGLSWAAHVARQLAPVITNEADRKWMDGYEAGWKAACAATKSRALNLVVPDGLG